jgi:hypothetical protein
MHALLIVALIAQVQVDVKTDAARTNRDRQRTVKVDTTDGDREPRRVAVTKEHLRTAFRSPAAATMLRRARAARSAQDSALVSYEATAYMRVSAGMGFSKIGRDRLVFRHENAAEIRWHRDVGAWIEVKGARSHFPAPADEVRKDNAEMADDQDLIDVPYYPGREPLITFNGNGLMKSTVDERDFIHPFAEGSEAYYTYAVGDSVVFRLPDGRSIRLRELIVRPRESRWNVAVGSLWFDAGSGQLVRAAYRLAVPLDVWAMVKEDDPEDYEEIPIWVRPMISPMHAQVTSIGVEYGLHDNRFWLPRLSTLEGSARVSFMRVPFTFQRSFRFRSINALDSLPTIAIVTPPQPPDSLSPEGREAWRDSVRQVRRQAVRDSIRQGLRPERLGCDSANGFRTVMRRVTESGMRIATQVPCDREKLWNSPALPGSLYDDGELLFGSAELEALKREALSLGVQPPMAFGRIPPELHYGLEYTRFNRVEGFSTGGEAKLRLGGGYEASLLARIGHADLEPNIELSLARTNLRRAIRARGYHRLVAANDWGNPLSFGSSLSALLFGRDEGFYYRATGAEIAWARDDKATWSYRAFVEQHDAARVENEFNLGAAFIPNIEARRNRFAGGAARFVHTRGLNPNGFRVFTDFRAEGAACDSAQSYGRAALDLTLSNGLGRYAGALTLSGGSSLGDLPAERRWYLGGAHTVRGQRADTAVNGDAFWLARVELGGRFQAARPVIFGDIGWTGSRERLSQIGRPLSGAGVGLSVLDGLVRVDLSRGIHPGHRMRLDTYVEARF